MCKFAITRKNNAFVAKIVNTRLTKIFMAIFAPNERLPTSATLIDDIDQDNGDDEVFGEFDIFN